MFVLYTSPTCGYCLAVKEFAKEKNIELEIRDITEGDNMGELIEKGGKMQVPFFVDTETGESMYESVDIMAYLTAHMKPGE